MEWAYIAAADDVVLINIHRCNVNCSIVHLYALGAESASKVRTIRKTSNYCDTPLPILPILRRHILSPLFKSLLFISIVVWVSSGKEIHRDSYVWSVIDCCCSPQTRHPSTIVAVLYARALDICLLNAFAYIVWTLLGVRTTTQVTTPTVTFIIDFVRRSRALADHSIVPLVERPSSRPPTLTRLLDLHHQWNGVSDRRPCTLCL